jgi:hypothetical protein
VLAVLTILVLAPILAELLSSYLGETGDLGRMLFTVAFLAPLYGGACLVIREVCLRTGRGWTGRLLLAAAFGVTMATLVDGSLFTASRPDAVGFDEAVVVATIGGFPAFAAVSWVVGHVAISIGAPTALAEGLFPRIRERPWLGPVGTVLVGLFGVGIALLIRYDAETVRADGIEAALSGAMALVLVAAAFSPLGRPRRAGEDRRMPSPALTACAGFVAMLVFDLAPTSWLGLALDLAVAAVAAWFLRERATPSNRWTANHVVAVAWGAIAARSAIGFLVPVPDGVVATAKYAQNAILLAMVLSIGVVLVRQSRTATRYLGGAA